MGSRFYVGQRVRTFKGHTPGLHSAPPQAYGLTGTIVSKVLPLHRLGYQRWEVQVDNGVGAWKFVHPVEQCMAPLYDGDVGVAWSDCAWRPRALERV